MSFSFDASQVKPREALEVMPAGWYTVALETVEGKATKDGTGGYLECTFNILDGQYAGRKLFDRLNLWNANAQAQEIAYRTLSGICHGTGIMRLDGPDVLTAVQTNLVNRPLKAQVKVRPAEGQYDAQNEIKAYAHVQDPKASNAGSGTAAPPALGPPAGFTPPGQAPAGPPAGGFAPPTGFGGAPQGGAFPGAPAATPGGFPGAPPVAGPAMPSAPAGAGGQPPPWLR